MRVELVDRVREQLVFVRKHAYRNEIQRLITHIKESYEENITLNSAADFVNMSPSYLSSVFKWETGQSFIE